MNNADSNPPAGISGTRDRVFVWLLCLLACVHVFVFSAAFPFFNNMDEQFHFDLVLKYAHGHLPRGLERVSAETMQYTRVYSSPEFLCLPGFFSNNRFPPPPGKSDATASPAAGQQGRVDWWWFVVKDSKKNWLNYEASQQPLYYTLAGLWWHAGQWCGWTGLRLLYWTRFLNILLVAALVRVGYSAARMIFPENAFLRLGVPALIAFMPQQAFYSIQNDVLSPLVFGLAFICLVRWMRAESPGLGLGFTTGFSLAATFLVKMSNAPLLGVSVLAVLFKTWRLYQAGKLRGSLPGLTALSLSAGLPMGCWLMWSKYAFGDFAGTAAKLRAISWTPKPFVEWWHHPIFTPHGLWTFLSELLTAFWQGEFFWHANLLHLPVVDAFYVIPSLCFLMLAAVKLAPRFSVATTIQRQALWLGLGCCIAGAGFLAFLSITYDFGTCPNPSRDHPYFIAGRLILGALIPFLLLLLYGVDCLLRRGENNWLRPVALAGMVLFMLISETITDWSVFSSQYNWFHL